MPYVWVVDFWQLRFFLCIHLVIRRLLKVGILEWAFIHQMVNTEIRLIILFAAKDGEALYSQKNKTRN